MKEELTAWQRVQLARNPNRPHTRDYIDALVTDFLELHGDRYFGDDLAMVGGLGRFDGRTVALFGHQKGRETNENIAVSFGMAHPEGYQKARRLMEMAEKFGLPVLSFIDTPGAHPGMEAEERNQAGAIARNLFVMSRLRAPIVALVIGEGGSGGALGIGLADRVLMLENSVYSVISPEGCAAILWKKQEAKEAAAESLRLTAPDLLGFGIIDEIIQEPAGGAHLDAKTTIEKVGLGLRKHLQELLEIPLDTLLEKRYEKYRRIGAFLEGEPPAEEPAPTAEE
ncbi:MAG TPA: acetyl-CoA carboxylase carboxyltransferase subunit alpha [bacterium]|uniref:Acetyl-coenzyme A carboxylase carboxyl transferase subunit alpha n=1 Tax=candidate division TA06 bacterium ADurb.Bin417 TaxID=1852828 RepID=A0A1V5MCB3_UNCT6|nr:MAG: Acetyl-coenzyme A carboxylase carboxyl transferase subunit alpha [candidate division TA06 bacterium ADurb.Bin417]HNQ35283.1 acetyl-CoA carboxylase carboxyltransferase subunit alpha [bacterium]HNS48211.1 acetyl-CoA carboxylase carboxyltransferase subunit alpha [bacterium]